MHVTALLGTLAAMTPSPMLASSSPVVPAGDEWVVEPKWDGFPH